MGDINGNRNLEDLTIRDLFALSLDNPAELSAGLDATDFEEIGKKVSAFSETIPWSRVQSEMAGVVSASLDTRLLDTWACAWKKYQELKDDVEESRKSPDAVVLSRLAEHSVVSSLHPYVEVFLGAKRLQKITFDVTLTTHIRGLVLGLKNAHIVSVQLANCEWTGSIATHRVILVNRELTKLNLPGRITLRHAIALAEQKSN